MTARRNFNLDVLRGVAILMVLGRHFDVLDCGWAGVDLFFVLSGFLISGLLFSEWQRSGGLEIHRFYIRRAFKILPPFYFFLAFTMRLTGFLPKEFLIHSLFLQNYIDSPSFPFVWGHTWSLAVEEHFYIALPLLLRLLMPSRFKAIPTYFVIISATALALRVRAGWGFSANEYSIWYAPTHLRIDSLFFGVLLSWLRYFHADRFAGIARNRLLMVVSFGAAVGMLVMFPLNSPVMHTFGFTVLYIGAGALLMLTIDLPPMSFLRPIAWIGTYSYSIYLWHRPFSMFIRHSGIFNFALYLTLSIGAGVLTSYVIERPSLALRDYLFPRGPGHTLMEAA